MSKTQKLVFTAYFFKKIKKTAAFFKIPCICKMKGKEQPLQAARQTEDNVKNETVKENMLISFLKNDEVSALETIIEDFSGYVSTVIRNFSRGRLSYEDIEELAADVFIKLWQNRKRLETDCGLKPYISAIARNLVKNRFRMLSPVAEDIEDIKAVSDFDLAQSVEISQILHCLSNGLSKVTKKQKEIFMRFYFYGEKTSEIGQKMNLKDSTVRCELTRARSKLKKYLNERGFEHV